MDIGSPPVERTPTGVIAYLRSPKGMKWVKYGSVSAIAIVTSQMVFAISHNGLDRSILESQVWAVIISTIPAFVLSRRWVWAQDGKVSMSTEVIPFWVLSVVQFLITVGIVALCDDWIRASFDDKRIQTVAVSALSLSLYGVMWMGKFFFLNNLLFRSSTETPAT
jgi:putative flippase GtrA